MKGALKIGIGLALLAAAAGFLLIAAAGARERGRTTWCRNNLRKLGEFGFHGLASREIGPPEDGGPAPTGRRFWQAVRRLNFTSERGDVVTWITRQGGANPFGCPVRGVQPLDLTELSQPDLDRHMSDLTTIDYRGPRVLPPHDSSRIEVLGGDLEGNHGGKGGHILLVNLAVHDVRSALQILAFKEAETAATGLSD